MTGNRRIFSIVLAAGQASRFGSSKLVEYFGDRPLIHRPLLAAQAVCPERVVLVTGNDAALITDSAGDLANEVVFNPDHLDGMGTSIAAGVHAVADRADAIIVLLGDQPLVSGDHVANIVDNWSGESDEIVATCFESILGPPAIFGSGLFVELQSLSGDQGARRLLNESDNKIYSVDFADAAIDIDTPDDLSSAAP